MKATYKIDISSPATHYVSVSLKGSKKSDQDFLDFFMPSWSPGSYLMREYGRHVRRFKAVTDNGEFLYFEKREKGTWRVDWSKSELKKEDSNFTISYEVYCNEISVRTSHVTEEHAFLHGPTLFMGVDGDDLEEPTLEITFPGLWSKVTTGLKDISDKREKFLYSAKNYDELIDTPIEIGCHDTNGFRVEGIDHHLAFYDLPEKLPGDLREDTKNIVETITKFWGEIPYEMYVFMGHFMPGIYGGLEHLNSTALQFCPLSVQTPEGYRDFLGLVAHEFFHTWNVKRIRPIELGPFDYKNENYTRMHWLTEGLTSCVDDLFVYTAGLATLEQYLETLTKRFNRLLETPGRRFDSLEESSFDAWVKLYRPHENSANSTVSYYLKGSIAFFCLNSLLSEKGLSLRELCLKLWERYKANPDKGMIKSEFFTILKDLAGDDICSQFEGYISMTTDLPLDDACKAIGLEIEYDESDEGDFGFQWKEKGEQLFTGNIRLDSPAEKAGLNFDDEIIAVNGLRLTTSLYKQWLKTLKSGHELYHFTVARRGKLVSVEIPFEKGLRKIKKITIKERDKAEKALQLL